MKKILKESILVSAECFRQRIELPKSQTSGISEVELETALLFEVEPFSGIQRGEGVMAWKRLEGNDGVHEVFDVVQIRKADMQEAVKRAKRGMKAITAVPTEGEDVVALPLIPLRTRGNGCSVALWAWICICVLVFAALAIEYMTISAERSRLRHEVSLRRQLQAKKDSLEAKISAVKAEEAELRRVRAEALRAQQNAEALRDAWKILLEALPCACKDEVVVKDVSSPEEFTAKISGNAVSADAASRFFVRLTEVLKAPKSAWQVKPGTIGGSVASTVPFSCVLVFDPLGQFR